MTKIAQDLSLYAKMLYFLFRFISDEMFVRVKASKLKIFQSKSICDLFENFSSHLTNFSQVESSR